MFTPDPSIQFVPATREQVVAIIEGINQPQVSIPGKAPQGVSGHLCGLRNANGTFSGGHIDGDIFVVSGFTSGGQTSAGQGRGAGEHLAARKPPRIRVRIVCRAHGHVPAGWIPPPDARQAASHSLAWALELPVYALQSARTTG